MGCRARNYGEARPLKINIVGNESNMRSLLNSSLNFALFPRICRLRVIFPRGKTILLHYTYYYQTPYSMQNSTSMGDP